MERKEIFQVFLDFLLIMKIESFKITRLNEISKNLVCQQVKLNVNTIERNITKD